MKRLIVVSVFLAPVVARADILDSINEAISPESAIAGGAGVVLGMLLATRKPLLGKIGKLLINLGSILEKASK